MGVLRPTGTPALVKFEEISYADYVFDDSGDDDDGADGVAVAVSAPTTPAAARRRQRTKSGRLRKMVGLVDDQPRSGKKVVSGRQLRRMENARLLSALVDPEDICEDLSDTLPAAITAFTKLFIEQDKMNAWNEFVEKDEEEQREFLENGGRPAIGSSGGHVLGGRGAGMTPKKSRKDVDSRSEHPAYSGEACFRRIDGRFRSLLSARHLPWGALTWMEQEMTEYFLSMPDGVYVQVLEGGMERLILHGVAQYLSLKSKSFDGPDAKRETQVENIKPFFIPPRQTLVDFLRQRRGERDQR